MLPEMPGRWRPVLSCFLQQHVPGPSQAKAAVTDRAAGVRLRARGLAKQGGHLL